MRSCEIAPWAGLIGAALWMLAVAYLYGCKPY